nr:40S ribosomal protein S2-like [Gorilla gorilla gorilla]
MGRPWSPLKSLEAPGPEKIPQNTSPLKENRGAPRFPQGLWVGPVLCGCFSGAIILTKLSIVLVRRGYWGNKIGKPHTVPCKVTGCCSSVLVRLIPPPRGTGIVSVSVPKKLLMMAGINDCYTSAQGCTATLGNFTKATFDAIPKTYSYLTPNLWKKTVFTKSPDQEFTDHLVKTHTRVSVQ